MSATEAQAIGTVFPAATIRSGPHSLALAAILTEGARS